MNQTPPPSFPNHEDACCSLYTWTPNYTHVAPTRCSSSPITFRQSKFHRKVAASVRYTLRTVENSQEIANAHLISCQDDGERSL